MTSTESDGPKSTSASTCSTHRATPGAAIVPPPAAVHEPVPRDYRGCDPPQASSAPRQLRAPKDQPLQGPNRGSIRPIVRRQDAPAPPGQIAARANEPAAAP